MIPHTRGCQLGLNEWAEGADNRDDTRICREADSMSSMTNPYAPPKATVRDISTPHTSLIYADRSTRLGAAILDGIIFMVMVYVPLFAVMIAGPLMAGPGRADAETRDAIGTLALVGFGLAFVGLAAWCWLTYKNVQANGQTIAKKMLNIKVVRTDGSPISVSRIFWLRNFVNGLLGIIPLYGLVELLFIFGESQQCLHDKIADTIVVKA
jgi:uncharacterized RDD family membrane protein YckC